LRAKKLGSKRPRASVCALLWGCAVARFAVFYLSGINNC